jgi:hypothetical protein
VEGDTRGHHSPIGLCVDMERKVDIRQGIPTRIIKVERTMKEVRRVKFTGKNLNDVFALPCVRKIIKIVNKPQLVIDPFMMVGAFPMNVASIGDEIVEYDNGQWKIVRK